ncbi:hypothetical protein RN001_006807 [Aquatica leii]|uniref:Uncharacterized protein n=1 Tax=Aquatica leii TaxID=1421715 RepID=A0AAN7QLC5_9COLE|nr:hypothetical protein RN001_006807 [Aquatica leii]
MHRRRISVSLNRIREVTSSLCHLTVNRAKEEGLLCPNNILKDVFVIGVYNNIDHNLSSNTSGSFHGTSMSVFQTPSDEQPGECRNFQTSYECDKPTLNGYYLPESFATVPNVFLIQKEPEVPNHNITSSHMSASETREYEAESDWLNHVLHSLSKPSQEGIRFHASYDDDLFCNFDDHTL